MQGSERQHDAQETASILMCRVGCEWDASENELYCI